ncbi:MAG: hypothetical protein HRT89_07360, partial [Lentisphaeria bacterium]|nr:hypothetical protein [Lentisphaeria bacterium]
VQKIEAESFVANFMVEKGSTNPLGLLKPLHGIWKIHSANDNALEKFKSKLVATHSPNFYSLKGSSKDGKPGIILTGNSFDSDYSMEAAVELGAGKTGIIFYYQGMRDYYRLTIEADKDETGILKLTRLSNTKTPRVALLAEERIKYRAKQWVMLKAEIKDDEIHCYVDQIERFSVAEALPVGGKYGVYVDNKELIRFDDIRKIELIDRDIRTVSNIRFYSFASQGEFYKKSGFLSFFSGSKIKDSDTVFKPVYQDDERWLILSSENTPHKRFSASFQTKQKHFTIGLICNYSAAKNTFDLLEYKETKGFSHYSVKQYSKGAFKTISNYKRRTMSRAYQNKLLIDKSDKSHIKFYRNGELMIHYSNPGATGAYGIYLGKNNSSSISKIRLSGEEKIHKNKFEKNNIYVGDPFMKHWSSPEGEWITNLKTKETWHKSDFFGRYAIHMPLVDKSRIHLSVEEGKNEGISFKISGAKLLLIDSAVKDRVLKSVTLNKSLKIAVAGFNFKNAAEAKKSLQIISVYYEDYWLWVKVKGQVIFAYRLLHPLKGRRIRIEGFTKQHLSNSFTDRYNVLDFLFNESPHNWEKNGGQWRVINRFQCRPSWSHFNGENDTGLAALWSKYKIKGDFCIEMYAGTRHGKWYNRVGDLNITLMNKTNNASSGYTFTCGGWDFNESQLWTSFYKDGKLIARSDAYTIPRFKNANKRQFLNPLTPTGRDVHGAWYYIKIRKIGKKIEYYFDNTLIFEHDDDEVIDEGSFGVWTYLNSMMIARLRVSADHISLKEVTLSEEIQPEESLEELESLAATLTVNEQPLNLLDKQYWSVNDPISQSRLSFQAEDNEPVIIVENKLGAGTMALESSLLPLPLATISGFRFLIKRSKTANLNFHYQLGKMETAKFIPYPESYFIHISGSDFSRSKFKKIASVDVPGLDRSEVFGDGEWTEVIVHIPANRKYPQDSSYIKLTGFGNFQRSYVQQGIKGNAPGDVYAIKSLQYIYYQTPVLELEKSTENKAYHNYLLVDAQSSKTLIDTKSVKQLISRMVKIRRNGLVRTTLQVISNDTEFDASIYWVNKSPDVEMTLNWSNDYLDCLELTNPNWQDFALASVKLVYLQDSGKELPLAIYKIEAGKIIYRLPPQITPKKNQLRFKTIVPDAHIYDIDAKNWTLSIDREKNAAPSLISLDGLIPYFLNFENIHTVRIGLNYPTIHLDDLEQNAYLEIANKTKAQRLSFSVKGPVNIAKYPLLQFKYRGTRSAEISGMLGHLKFQINEKMAKGGNDIRISEKAVFDYDLMNSKKKWRSWTGLLSKTASTNTWISESLSVPKSLAIRSFASRNQTGIYTWWHLDDLLFGPATNKKTLEFTPIFYDLDGIWHINAAVYQSDKPFSDLTKNELIKLRYKELKNKKRGSIDISRFTDGIIHLILKVTDQNQNGTATSFTDIPILIDRKPIGFSSIALRRDLTYSTGPTMNLIFSKSAGSALDYSSLKISSKTKTLTMVNPVYSPTIQSPAFDTIQLNWPMLFRHDLRKIKNGE